MKAIIFTIIALTVFPSLAQNSKKNKVPIVQTVCLKSSDFSPLKSQSENQVSGSISLPESYAETESISLSLEVFLKDKPTVLETVVSVNSSIENITLLRDSHGNPLNQAILFHPVEIRGGASSLTFTLNTGKDNVDSILVTTVGFQKGVSYSITGEISPGSMEKDFTNCNCSQPSYTSRNGWGCPQGSWGTTQTVPTHLVIHHEAAPGSSPNTSNNWANRVYGIWNYHVNTQGWSDVGYNWLIDPNGVIYEGRHSSSSANPQGAHWTCNSGSMAVCMLGNYSSATITPQAKASLEELLAWKACQFSIDPVSSSYNAAQMATLNNICGHLNGPCSNTVCPGSGLYSQIPSIRSGVLADITACSPVTNSEDIFITNESVSNNMLAPGDNFTVYATQNYSGNQLDSQLPSFDLDYYLSTDCSFDNNDVLLGGDVSGLGSDDPFNDENEGCTIPNGTPNGNYYILFVADNDDELVESDETNNVECVAITVGTTLPEDIFITNESVSNNMLAPGDNFTVYATQNYSGSQLDSQLPSFHLDYYLSTDCNLDNNDVLLGGDVSGLGSDDPANDENENLTIPNGTAPGNYYILFAADNDDDLVESDETNNVVCVAITVGTDPEDVFLTNVSVSNTILNPGDNFNVYATQNYSGSQTTSQLPSFNLDYYLSIDCTLDNNDILLGGDISSIGSNDLADDETETLTIPTGTAPGIYFILFSADNNNVLVEIDELNNIQCVQIEVPSVTQSEDIYVSNATTSSANVLAGTAVYVTINQSYSGSQTSSSLNDVALGYYLSTDCTVSSDDTYLGGDFSTIGSDIPTEVETADLTIPSSIASGNYFILFVGDSNDDFTEVDEQNNIECIPVLITNINSIGSDLEEFGILIYPNPTKDFLQIENCEGMELEIIDVRGRIVFQKKCSSNDLKIDVSKFASGEYTLHFIFEENHVASKIVKL